MVDIDSPMYKEKDSNNDPIFSFQPKHCSFPYYSGVWFQSEGFDTNTILREKSIIEYVHLPLDNEKRKSYD